MRRSTRSAFSALQLWDPKGGIVALDGLRGIAILLVLMRHAAYPVVAANPDGGGLDSAWFTFMVNGWVGVDLFFVLSGFLIGAHVLRMYERSPHHTFQWGRYLQNRFLRIVPTYVFVIAWIVAGAVPYYNVGDHELPLRLLYHALFLQDYLPSNFVVAFWSLGVEEKFYLLAPFVLGVGLTWQKHWRYGLVAAVVGIIGLSVFSRTGLALGQEDVPYQTFFETFRSPFHHCLDALGMGILAAITFRSGIGTRLARPAMAIGAVGIIALLSSHQLLGEIAVWDMTLQPTFISICFALMVWAAAHGAGPRWFLENRLLIINARLSYPLYLLHMTVIPLAWVLSGAQPSDGIDGLVAFLPYYLGLAYLGAYGVHLLIEKPFLMIKEKLASVRPATPSTPTRSQAASD